MEKHSGYFDSNIILKFQKTVDGRNFLKMHYRHIINLKSHPERFLLEFIIWMTDFQHKKIISSKHLYIDRTFHVPKNFYQLIIILYYDELTNKPYPGAFILINSKTEIDYQICLSQFSEILSSYGG